ncbi:unnamed protein product, partial [Ceratitis capitata]
TAVFRRTVQTAIYTTDLEQVHRVVDLGITIDPKLTFVKWYLKGFTHPYVINPLLTTLVRHILEYVRGVKSTLIE